MLYTRFGVVAYGAVVRWLAYDVRDSNSSAFDVVSREYVDNTSLKGGRGEPAPTIVLFMGLGYEYALLAAVRDVDIVGRKKRKTCRKEQRVIVRVTLSYRS